MKRKKGESSGNWPAVIRPEIREGDIATDSHGRKFSREQAGRRLMLAEIQRQKQESAGDPEGLMFLENEERDIVREIGNEPYSGMRAFAVLEEWAKKNGLAGIFVIHDAVPDAGHLRVSGTFLEAAPALFDVAEKLLCGNHEAAWEEGLKYFADFSAFLQEAAGYSSIGTAGSPAAIAHKEIWEMRDCGKGTVDAAARALLISACARTGKTTPVVVELKEIEPQFSMLAMEGAAEKVALRMWELAAEMRETPGRE